MNLWLVHDFGRWGFSINVVRAETKEMAIQLVRPNADTKCIEVMPLPPEGEPAVIWCHDECPDSVRD